MTDTPYIKGLATDASAASRALIAKRYAAERRFRLYGLLALLVTAVFLAALVVDIVRKGYPAFTEYRAQLNLTVPPEDIDPAKIATSDFEGIVRKAWIAEFPEVKSRQERKQLTALLSTGAGDDLRSLVTGDQGLVGKDIAFSALLSGEADLYLKGQADTSSRAIRKGPLQWAAEGEGFKLTGDVQDLAEGVVVVAKNLSFRIGKPAEGGVLASSLVAPAEAQGSIDGAFSVITFDLPESSRRISDLQASWLEMLQAEKRLESDIAWRFFTSGDSREAELSGLRAALIGSLLTVAITLLLSVPLGVAAALYLEEFAPKNRWTDLIEVNINNLAAVPSIIFGLLGLAVFLNFFNMPRSAPLVGGLVLALLVLPTIIIASRAAFKAVPPSIKEAALGVGASHQQAIFHHVLPLAMPGILTGIILGVARALGETAPLLMIGMVAFIVDIPKGFTDAATVLPVQIFLWSDLPEIAFQSRTAAAIIVLLIVLFSLNALAIYLRRRFERRW